MLNEQPDFENKPITLAGSPSSPPTHISIHGNVASTRETAPAEDTKTRVPMGSRSSSFSSSAALTPLLDPSQGSAAYIYMLGFPSIRRHLPSATDPHTPTCLGTAPPGHLEGISISTHPNLNSPSPQSQATTSLHILADVPPNTSPPD